MKPVYVRDVVRALAPHVQPQRHLIVSIAAGVKLDSIEELLPPQTRVVRPHLITVTLHVVLNDSQGLELGCMSCTVPKH